MQDHGEVSSQFRSLCKYARKRSPYSYAEVGKYLVWERIEQDCSTNELLDLLELLKAEEDEALLAWVRKHYPRHLRCVPAKQYVEFLNGIYDGAERLKLFVLPRRLEEADVVEVKYLFADTPPSPPSLLARLRPSPN
jgi:hypothetical protein